MSEETEDGRKKPQLPDSWLVHLQDEFDKPYMAKLREFLKMEQQRYKVYPPNRWIFNAFNATPFDDVKVVVLGQDPYHGAGQAHGLSFSVRRGVRVPPSLRNIYTELRNSLGVPTPDHGELTTWAEQGVLLLNTTLTVRQGDAKSHAGKGWETFTDRVIQVLNEHLEHLVFILWGAHARSKQTMIDHDKHLVLTSPHPSPFSADKGFFGCNHFADTNRYLERQGKEPIDWRVPD